MNVAQILIKRLRKLFRFPGIAKRKTALPKSSRVSPAPAARPRGLRLNGCRPVVFPV
jgi:hypothetical protein